MKKFILKTGLLLLVSFMFFSGCKKDKKETPTPTNPTTTSVTLTGNVIDVNNTPLSGVTVKVGTTTTTTNSDGSFYLSNVTVPISRFVVEFSSSGFFTLVRSAVPTPSEKYDLEVGLISETDVTYAGSTSFASNTTGNLTMGNGCIIDFPANAFITSTGSAFSGTVYVKAAYLDPTMNNYPMFVFGGDLYGKDSTGTEVMINPYAGLNVIITDGANKLQLDTIHNVKADVQFNIPNTLLTSAPNTIELFDFDENAGMAYANGTATKTGGKYMGQVQHFSFWNCAEFHPGKALISGYVTDASGSPIPGMPVRVGHTFAKTDIDGYYKKIVPTGVPITVKIFPSYLSSVITPQNISSLTDGGSATNVNFSIPGLKKVTGKIVNCAGNPVQAKVFLGWYSNIAYNNVHTSCFTKTDGTFTLFMENSISAAVIHVWGNGSDVANYIYPSTNPFDAGNIKICPPGPTTLVLNGGPFTTSTTFSSFDSKKGYKYIDTLGNAHTEIFVYGSDGMYNISTNGFPTTVPTTYTIGTKSNGPTSMHFNTFGAIQASDSLQSGTIKITKVGAVDDLIEGNFSGTSYSGIAVSGVFSVPRHPDN